MMLPTIRSVSWISVTTGSGRWTTWFLRHWRDSGTSHSIRPYRRPTALPIPAETSWWMGFGTGFASRLIVNENPHLTETAIDTILSRYCGLHRFVKMSTLLYDGIHHIDMHMKLLDEETLLIGQYPVNVSDYTIIENTVAYLRTLENCYGRPYRIVRIPMPPSSSGQYPPNSNYYTYTNSVIINRTVLVPVYGFPLDVAAMEIYREAMPGYTVVGYDCNAIIPQSGAIHCITKEIGVREPVRIAHAYHPNTTDTTADYRVQAVITSARTTIDSTFIFWTTDTSSGFTAIPMTDSSGSYIGHIPRQPHGSSIWYYLSATTGSGRTVTKPMVGARGPFRFDIVDSTATTVRLAGVPGSFELSQNFPNPFNPTTTIRFSLPSSVGTLHATSLRVYDVLGREVTTLVHEELEPGTYTAEWDAGQAASGVYHYRLSVSYEGGSYVATKKAMLLK